MFYVFFIFADNLHEILNKLLNEDRIHRPCRRAIGFSQVIKKASSLLIFLFVLLI